MTGREFADAVAAQLGLEPLSDADAEALLDLAGVAAHSSERLAAPLCTYLAGQSGRPIADVRSIVDGLSGP